MAKLILWEMKQTGWYTLLSLIRITEREQDPIGHIRIEGVKTLVPFPVDQAVCHFQFHITVTITGNSCMYFAETPHAKRSCKVWATVFSNLITHRTNKQGRKNS
jgi:hypothetical protein